jgi:hypothetical protein
MAQNYDSRTVTQTNTSSCQCPPYYIRTVPGILKIVEMILAILTFACAFGGGSNFSDDYGGGWVEFVGISALIYVAIWLILHLINFIPQFLINFLVELIGYAVLTVFFLIAGIVAAVAAGKYSYWYLRSEYSSIVASCVFAFFSMVVYGFDTVLQLLAYRGGTYGASTTATTTTTHTTFTTTNTVY